MKKEDFIVGNWYKSTTHVNLTAFKFESHKWGNIFISEYIKNDEYFKQHGNVFENISTMSEVSILDIAKYLPEGHPDLKILSLESLNMGNEKELFPATGCYYDDQDIVFNYLIKNNYLGVKNFDIKYTKSLYIKWDNFKYWYIAHPSREVKNYTTQQIIQLINSNKNETNIVQSTKTKNSRSSIKGTIILRRGGQQITVGLRPKGNQTISNTGTTRINSIKICKNVVKCDNY